MLLLCVACDARSGPIDEGPAGGKADDASDAGFSAYPAMRLCRDTEPPCFTRLGELLPTNVVFESGDAQDQGEIASCASHSFIGMLENHLATQRGIVTDLAERYQLYANFMDSGNMGTDPNVIAQFPSIVARAGLMPEATYPYDEVLVNAERFAPDLAQGLSEGAGETVDDAIAPTDARSAERHEVLSEPRHLGALPELGGHPVALPAAAQILPGARIPEIEFIGADGSAKIVPCFADDAEVEVEVTPREFLELCFDHDPDAYYACEIVQPALPDGDEVDCDLLLRAADVWAEELQVNRVEKLATMLHSMDQREAVLVGVTTPIEFANKAAPLWNSGMLNGGGHAVTAVGYVSADSLRDPEQHDDGLLAEPSLFDRLAARADPGHLDAIAAADSLEAVAEVRQQSAFGEQVLAEGGMIVFRNSWGTRLGDGPEIGVEGYQSMTFDFFLSHARMVEARNTRPALLDAPSCTTLIGHSDPYFASFSDRVGALAFRTMGVGLLTAVATAGSPIDDTVALLLECREKLE